MRELIWRLRAMWRRHRAGAETHDELQFHHDMAVEAGLRRGLSPEDARRYARHQAGAVSQGVEATREAMGVRWLDGALADLRHAVRALTRNRGFGAVAVLVLAASVAINTLIFFMLDGVVLRPLPYGSPERLVRIYEATEGQPKFPLSIGRFLDYRANAHSLEAIALYTGQDMELSGADGRSEQLTGVAITVRPRYGRRSARGVADRRVPRQPRSRSFRHAQRPVAGAPRGLKQTGNWLDHLHSNHAFCLFGGSCDA